jgi:F-type H+-transporting ATPase subunit delta
MRGSVLGRRYAAALLDLGVSDGRAEPYGEQLHAATDALVGAGALKVLASPLFDAQAKAGLLDTVERELQLTKPVANLLRLLLDKRRIKLLPEVNESYRELLDRHAGRTRAVAIAAAPLDSAVLGRLRMILQMKIGKKVELTARTDASVIGGLRVEVGAKVYDATVANHLARLRERLNKV